MKINGTSFNTFFPKVPDMRYKLFNFEKELSRFFMVPFNTIPVPDEAPSEIPRLNARSHQGHGELNVSLDRLSFVSKYDDRFNNDWVKCAGYLKDRIIPMTSIIQGLVNDTFLYSGLTTEISLENLDQEPIKHFLDKFIKVKTQTDPFDVNVKVTYVVEENYYLNIALANQRIYSGNNPEVEIPAYLEQVGTGLILHVDVNDRHGFNYNKNYRSTAENVNKILDITTDFVDNKLNKIIYEGEFQI